jgi:pimeloyl-ACP methyl ester carboxylesterase
MDRGMTVLYAIAAILALAALVVFILKLQAEKRHPPMGDFLDCDGVRLHYILRGPADAPVVVLVHGNGALIQEQVISMVDALSKKYRVLCYDRPGYGYTSRPRLKFWTPEAQAALLAQAMQRLDLRDAIILGHSWGTLVAIALALASPEKVRGLVLVSGYFFPTGRLDFWMMAGPAVPLLGDLFRFTLTPFIARLMLWPLVRKLFSPQPVTDVFKQEFPVGLAMRPISIRASAEESGLIIPAAKRLAERYAELTQPTAVVAGKADWLVEARQSSRLKDVLPRAVLREVPDAGHMVTHTATGAIVDAVDLIHAWPKAG